MGLNIKNPEVERLAAEVAALAKETKTEAIRRALIERRERLGTPASNQRKKELFQEWLRNEWWPTLPDDLRGKGISQEEQDEILGYGPEGF
jgi:antitoxin VapB